MKSTQIFPFKEIQIYGPYLRHSHFFLAIRCGKDLARQISSSSETPRNFSKLYSNPTHRTFPKFSFEFHLKSGQVPMGKDVPCLELFPSIFYLKFLEPARPSFPSNYFKLIQNNSNNSKTVLCSRAAQFPSPLGPAHACSRARARACALPVPLTG
jgi:hypothetical protein